MCITVSKARDCRNTSHSSSVIVIYLRFLHIGNTIRNTLQCIDCPGRNKLEEDKAVDFKLHFVRFSVFLEPARKCLGLIHSFA